MSPVGAIGALPAGAGATARTPEQRAALAFERQLVEQLAKQLAETAKPAGDDASSAAGNAYLDMLPGALADAVTAAGGLGLAAQLVPTAPKDGAR